MGNANTKIGDTRPSTRHDSHATPPKNTSTASLQQKTVDWEQVYDERFARTFTFSTYAREPFFDYILKPTMTLRWQDRLNTDNRCNKCNPRYMGPTPEPLTEDLAARTRHELRVAYRRSLIEFGLRYRLREAWADNGRLVVRVPYLRDDVKFPRASEIKNGYLLPARVRADILGHREKVAPDKDPFLKERLEEMALELRMNHAPPVAYEDDLLRASWLNHTAAVYFEPEFGRLGIDYMGRCIFSAWREIDEARGETSNLQQMRYLAHPVMLVGGPKRRPIADVISTHKRICDAVADAQGKAISPKDRFSWVEHGAEMGVIYQSIIIVVDKKPDQWRGANEAETRDIMFQQSSVLLVRTGNEEHLSEQIDFSQLGPAILPLGRDEVLHDKQEVVRVRLRAAVRFIMDLERRERERCPRLTAMRKTLDNATFREADNFASDALAVAEGNGSIDRDWYTWEAVRRARAYLDGEPFHVDAELAEWDGENRNLHRWI